VQVYQVDDRTFADHQALAGVVVQRVIAFGLVARRQAQGQLQRAAGDQPEHQAIGFQAAQ